MAHKSHIFWYGESSLARNAFLFNCRDADLIPSPGNRISKGSIVTGSYGFVAAEELVPGFEGTIQQFRPNRRCSWQGFELACMTHPDTPPGKSRKAELRHFNYIVAELPNQQAISVAQCLKLPIVADSEGRKLVNLEIACFERQGKANPRRAKLLEKPIMRRVAT